MINILLQKDPMGGITTPYCYLGKRGTPSALHNEHGDLPSVNLLLDGAPKFWIAIPRIHESDLQENIRQKFRLVGRTCNYPLDHRDVFVTIDFLEENGIPWTYCIQRPGDIVFTNPGVSLGYDICFLNFLRLGFPSSYQPGLQHRRSSQFLLLSLPCHRSEEENMPLYPSPKCL